MFKKVTIIGFGLIGSSMAHAIKRAAPDTHICAADKSQSVIETVLKHKLADSATSDLAAGVQEAGAIILSVPVGAMGDVMAEIAPHLQEGVCITDTGSVKASVIKSVSEALPEHASFIPAHPIAGTEFSGPLAGFAELFENRWIILTPPENTPLRSIEKVTELWEMTGGRIEIMSPNHHDLVLGITSHLPHLIAYTIVGTATNLEDDIQSEVIKFSASGFRDFTRIAASDPTMWRDVFLNNKEAVLEILQRFTEDLTAMQRAIRYGDGDYLYRTFEQTRNIRRAIIEAGQADYPDAPDPEACDEAPEISRSASSQASK